MQTQAALGCSCVFSIVCCVHIDCNYSCARSEFVDVRVCVVPRLAKRCFVLPLVALRPLAALFAAAPLRPLAALPTSPPLSPSEALCLWSHHYDYDYSCSLIVRDTVRLLRTTPPSIGSRC